MKTRSPLLTNLSIITVTLGLAIDIANADLAFRTDFDFYRYIDQHGYVAIENNPYLQNYADNLLKFASEDDPIFFEEEQRLCIDEMVVIFLRNMIDPKQEPENIAYLKYECGFDISIIESARQYVFGTRSETENIPNLKLDASISRTINYLTDIRALDFYPNLD